MLPATTDPKFDVVTTHGVCDDNDNDVSVRLAAFHTSEVMSVASVPKLLKVRELYAQIVAGNDASVAPSDDDALFTTVFVFAFTFAATEVDAVFTMLLVFALTAAVAAEIAEASEVEAF